jgi:hypothetical protein
MQLATWLAFAIAAFVANAGAQNMPECAVRKLSMAKPRHS